MLILESENQIVALMNKLDWPVVTSVARLARILVPLFRISAK